MPLKESLVGNGYFPKEVPPAFSTTSLAAALNKIPSDLLDKRPFNSKCAYHSIPRLIHVRRLLGIPNPRHQIKLISVLSDHWREIEAHMATSQLSRSRLEQDSSSVRALKRIRDFDELGKDMVCFPLPVQDTF